MAAQKNCYVHHTQFSCVMAYLSMSACLHREATARQATSCSTIVSIPGWLLLLGSLFPKAI